MAYIQFFDTTLRDGEQTPGVNFNQQEKIQIAKQLETYGIDVIEAGFPIASDGDFHSVKEIASVIKNATVCGLARSVERDIDRAYEALRDAANAQVHVFLATSDVHMKHKLKMSRAEVLQSISHHVTHARKLFPIVQFSPEDATRTDLAFLVQAVQAAIDAGATVINIPDTVGFTNPTEFGALFRYLRENIPRFDEVIFSTHCHDDLGMSVANALSAIENGARRVEGTINGIGERAGNTALEEVAVALHIRNDYYKSESGIILNQTKKTSDLISRLSGMPVPRNKAIIGGNAYAHESGIHQDGVLKEPTTYEIITPALVGVEKNSLPLGKLSGRHAFVTRMEELGYTLTDEEKNDAFKRFKHLADVKKDVTEDDLHALILGQSSEQAVELNHLQVQYVTGGVQGAIIRIHTEDGTVLEDAATGAGSIEAIYNTINRLLEQDVTLTDYRIQAITAGHDAQAEVHVVVQDNQGETYHGIGIDNDVLTASAKSYLHASAKASASKQQPTNEEVPVK
ncbi:2-isopropylmalate synthase [Listeria booriae]|uniref:2-isopropylmalate synthase n=1 Tax=Listeria booriae TaxID=1552123 RepID=UPI0016246EA4|nr:2-isopropylmalate synthase [Listeria booriae]MBC1232764.1 2-isopropylmalate synthase [Listeria booriae]MBC1245723.1 2-isopropylmalate synthase [Listeria booriae]